MQKKKTQISYLGTDIELFNPKIKKNIKLKEKLGFKKNNFVCIYTGRLDESKSPHLMSQAVKKLNDDGHKNVRGLFIGNHHYDVTDHLRMIAEVGRYPVKEKER